MGRLFHSTIREMTYCEEDAVTTRPGRDWTQMLLYIGRNRYSQGIAISLKPPDDLAGQYRIMFHLAICDLTILAWVYRWFRRASRASRSIGYWFALFTIGNLHLQDHPTHPFCFHIDSRQHSYRCSSQPEKNG